MSLRDLPAVHELAARIDDSGLPALVRTMIARTAVDEARATILAGGEADAAELARTMASAVAKRRPTSVVNATGIVIHTNLGRAPLHPEAAAAQHAASTGYGNVELDLGTGERGGRGAYVRTLLTELTGAEDAHVVGNNAGALYAVLNAIGRGGEVPVSRGELIEIGGSYRLPDLMAASGVRMIEVGTTNRTRASDYAEVVSDATTLILKVHPSNYQVVGFSEDAPLSELRSIATEADVPLIFDAGSGLLDADAPWLGTTPTPWLRDEPGIRQSVSVTDLTLFSGDKLLGGPQAGIIVGRSELVQQIRTHPLARALRIAGPPMAALSATLELYADGRAGEIPVWRMAAELEQALKERSAALAERTGGKMTTGTSMLGGGSTPGAGIPTPTVEFGDADRRHAALLAASPPVVARRDAGKLVVDLRTVEPGWDAHLADLLGD